MASSKVLARRAAATQATVDKFLDKTLRPGRRDCGQMLAFHLAKIGRGDLVPKIPEYKTWRGARQVLDGLGWSTVADALKGCEEIPPAAAVVGDVVEMPALESAGAEIAPMGGVGIAVGNGAVICYVEGHRGAVTARVLEAVRAWRVLPHDAPVEVILEGS